MKDFDLVYIVEEGEKRKNYRLEYRKYSVGEKTVPAKNVRLEILCDMMDQHAESTNCHTYVGMHRLLGTLLFKNLGRKKATDIMRQVAEMGALHGMNGLDGATAAFKKLGISDFGGDWTLKRK